MSSEDVFNLTCISNQMCQMGMLPTYRYRRLGHIGMVPTYIGCEKKPSAHTQNRIQWKYPGKFPTYSILDSMGYFVHLTMVLKAVVHFHAPVLICTVTVPTIYNYSCMVSRRPSVPYVDTVHSPLEYHTQYPVPLRILRHG